MRRITFSFALILFVLYVLLHLVLGSSPVQKRVVSEIQSELKQFGLELKIESIEFSALMPRIYLNRVTLSATPKSPLHLPHPLKVDKLRLEFQPLALISRRIVIEDITLFHPVIRIPQVDKLASDVVSLIKRESEKKISLGTLKLVIKKIAIVDALVDVSSKIPELSLRSHSLEAEIQNLTSRQQWVSLKSGDIEITVDKNVVTLDKVNFDADLSDKSLRVNEGVFEGQGILVHGRGSSSLPLGKKQWPESLNLNYEVQLPLALLNRFPSLKAPHLEGVVNSSGTLQSASGAITGKGNVKYQDLVVTDVRVGSGAFAFSASDRTVNLSEATFNFGGGQFRSENLKIGLKDRFPLSGDFELSDLRLESILSDIRVDTNPVRLRFDGSLKAKGFLAPPFEIDTEMKAKFSGLAVIKNEKLPPTDSNQVLAIKDGTMEGTLIFTREKMAFQAVLGLLGGQAKADGYVGFNHTDLVRVQAEKLSLTQLGRIGSLDLGGKANLTSQIEVTNGEALINGRFDVSDAEVSHLVLGEVKGQAFYRNDLLTFEKLSASSSGDVQGNGFIDFSGKTKYRFDVAIDRSDLDQVFHIFQKRPLTFPIPTLGEVSGHVVISGGDGAEGPGENHLQVLASGDAKRFKWYGENWQSAAFAFDYRPDRVELTRVMLLKKSGGLEIRGHFTDDEEQSWLAFESRNLRLEELNALGKAPLAGEITGAIKLTGKISPLPEHGSGALRLTKVAFRGNPLPDSSLQILPQAKGTEILFDIVGESLKARLVRPAGNPAKEELLLYCRDFDFAPLLTAVMGRDIPTLTELKATGDLALNGDLTRWTELEGSGAISQLAMGLRGTPMHNEQSLKLRLKQGNFQVDRFHLVGAESQLAMDFSYRPEAINASLDATLDLQFLQPFIPGLDYGAGKVSAGLRLSGKPEKFQLLGNANLEDGVFRLTGLNDEFRSVQAQISISQDRINVDRFQAAVNGGGISVDGDVTINRFHSLIPNLTIAADRVTMKMANALSATFSGDFYLRGNSSPYLLGGKCWISEGRLTRFDMGPSTVSDSSPVLTFDIDCEGRDKLLVNTEIMDAEMRGRFHLVGTNTHLGLLGSVDVERGSILFRETKFDLNSGSVKFESADRIAPRFTISGQTTVKDQSLQVAQQYEINLQVFGTPESYKVRLSSSPPLPEADITSLLVLGVTTRGNGNNDSGVYDLGSTVLGQIPLKSKLQNELGVDIRINSQPGNISSQPVPTANGSNTDIVQKVQIKKDITRKTKVSYSNTLEAIPVRELKIEHALDDNFSINATATDGAPGSTSVQSVQSYGLDVIYRFPFK